MLSRTSSSFSISYPLGVSRLRSFDPVVYLNSNNGNDVSYLALGAKHITQPQTKNIDSFELLKKEHTNLNDWLFGYFSYDLKNELEELSSTNPGAIKFPDLFFFQPKLVLEWSNNIGIAHYFEEDYTPQEIDELISKLFQNEIHETQENLNIQFKPDIRKEEYLSKIEGLLKELEYGNIYEVNFCQQFQSLVKEFDPYQSYQKLNTISPVPFSSFVKSNGTYALCASPERFIKHCNGTITSQPIKGTIKRGNTPEEDVRLKTVLQESAKDKKENVMIVDLVRNDLSRCAEKGSVKVEELFGVYSFPQVHQLISTISCQLKPELHPIDSIKMAFPMGSMTGAPKVKAMEIIDSNESFKRGLYSGSIGYIKPNADFDFNVVIRTLFYDKESNKISFAVGGAITIDSNPLAEYEESLLKAKAIFQLFETA